MLAGNQNMVLAHRFLQQYVRSLLTNGRQLQTNSLWMASQVARSIAATSQISSKCSSWQQPSLPQQSQLPTQLLLPFCGFAAHYAKGKASKKQRDKGKAASTSAEDMDEGEAAETGSAGDEPEFDPEYIQQLMEATVEHLQHELSGVRTGRANPGLLENLLVDAHGDRIPIKACGSVTVKNSQLLAVVLYDITLAKAVEKAVRESPLSLNAQTEGSEVLVKLPRMTKETIEKMVKLVNMEAEGAHQSIRRARQKGMEAVKKIFKNGSADDRKRAEKEIQKLHDEYVGEVERLRKIKDTELREHKD